MVVCGDAWSGGVYGGGRLASVKHLAVRTFAARPVGGRACYLRQAHRNHERNIYAHTHRRPSNNGSAVLYCRARERAFLRGVCQEQSKQQETLQNEACTFVAVG